MKLPGLYYLSDGTPVLCYRDANSFLCRRTLMSFDVFESEEQLMSYLEAHTATYIDPPRPLPTQKMIPEPAYVTTTGQPEDLE